MILVHGKILDKPRAFISRINWFRKLLKCAMCTGFWVGFYALTCVGSLLYCPIIWVYYLMTLPFASSGVSFLLERIVINQDEQVALLEHINKELEEKDGE